MYMQVFIENKPQSRGRFRGRLQGVHTPPEIKPSSSYSLQKFVYLAAYQSVMSFLRGAPPPKKKSWIVMSFLRGAPPPKKKSWIVTSFLRGAPPPKKKSWIVTSFLRGAPPHKKNPGSAPAKLQEILEERSHGIIQESAHFQYLETIGPVRV